MTSEEYHSKRKEVLERFGDFEEMSKLAREDVYMDKVVSCLIYGEENEYELILSLIYVIKRQVNLNKELFVKYAYPQIIKSNERT